MTDHERRSRARSALSAPRALGADNDAPNSRKDVMTHSRQRSRTRRWLSAPIGDRIDRHFDADPDHIGRGPRADQHGPRVESQCGQRDRQRPRPRTPPGLGQPPPLAPIHLAMVHGAIYDAVMAIVDTHEPYLKGLNARRSSSQAAAVAAAARGVLVGLSCCVACGHGQRGKPLCHVPREDPQRKEQDGAGSRSAAPPRQRCSPTGRMTAASAPRCSLSGTDPASGGSSRHSTPMLSIGWVRSGRSR